MFFVNNMKTQIIMVKQKISKKYKPDVFDFIRETLYK